jgi:hypothetical protein
MTGLTTVATGLPALILPAWRACLAGEIGPSGATNQAPGYQGLELPLTASVVGLLR